MMNRLLLVQFTSYIFPRNFMYRGGLLKLHKYLLSEFPDMEPFLQEKFFNFEPIWEEKALVAWWKARSTACTFIAKNINTPTTVLEEPVNSCESVLNELEKAREEGNSYTHLGFSVYVNSYSKFVKCAKAVKKFDPNIVTIAGNVGALFESTEKFVDHVCRGDGVAFLRELFKEDINKPYILNVLDSPIFIETSKGTIITENMYITTKLGCPNKCDFCVTQILFKGKFLPSFCSPQQLYDTFIEIREKKKKDFLAIFAEPLVINSHKWWYEFFDLFKDEPNEYSIVCPTTLASIKGFDFDRVSRSSLRFGSFQIGIESLGKNYNKNPKYSETQKIIKKLFDYGINTIATYIIGFDYQDRDIIWEEVENLMGLDVTEIMIFNLHPLPYTSIWNQYKNEGRLLNVPIDFYYLDGFQSYTHPHFKPGFEDMLPLLYDISKYTLRAKGDRGIQYIRVLENAIKLREELFGKNDKILKSITKRYKTHKAIYGSLFNSWKENLNPFESAIKVYSEVLERKF